MGKRILVVTTAPLRDEGLHERVQGADVRIVAPAADLSRLDWLANDEDEARDEAADRAELAGRAAAPKAESVEAEVGDADPVQAIEDALRTFAADELLLVTRRDEDAGWLEEGSAEEALARFDLPVARLVVDEG
ncbi:MAG: hypothetical protein ACRDNG_00035 [Gaiellaceae bacterium]